MGGRKALVSPEQIPNICAGRTKYDLVLISQEPNCKHVSRDSADGTPNVTFRLPGTKSDDFAGAGCIALLFNSHQMNLQRAAAQPDLVH